MAPDKVLVTADQLFSVIDHCEDALIGPELPAEPYLRCTVYWAEECFVVRMADFLSIQKIFGKDVDGLFNELPAIRGSSLDNLLSIPIFNYQTTSVSVRCAFAAWKHRAPFPASPNLALLHCGTQVVREVVPIQKIRSWPETRSGPQLAYALGSTSSPFSDEEFNPLAVVLEPIENVTGAVANIPAIQCCDLPNLHPSALRDPGLKRFPRCSSMIMNGTASLGLVGSPVFCASDDAASVLEFQTGMFSMVDARLFLNTTCIEHVSCMRPNSPDYNMSWT